MEKWMNILRNGKMD